MSEAVENLIERAMDIAEACSAPIWVNKTKTSSPQTVKDSGTCGLFFTGEKFVMITAHHVLKKFSTTQKRHKKCVLCVNIDPGATLVIEDPEVIDEDESLDIAILNFPGMQSRTKRYFPIFEWPIALPERGNVITIVGFPGRARFANDTIGVFEPQGIGVSVTSVSDRSILLADESGTRTVSSQGNPIDEQIFLGGFSGAPAFVSRGIRLDFVGIVRAGSKGGRRRKLPTDGVIFISPAHYLKPDGTLDRLRMPW